MPTVSPGLNRSLWRGGGRGKNRKERMSSLLLSDVLRYRCGERQEKVEEEGKAVGESNGFRLGSREEAEASSESSSIGAASSLSSERNGSGHGGEEDEEEVESKRKDGALGSLDSLEDSLPIKRGLSNFFSGKSKSFATLSDVANSGTNDIVKPENPFNKRRRVLMMSKMRRASCSSPRLPTIATTLGPSSHCSGSRRGRRGRRRRRRNGETWWKITSLHDSLSPRSQHQQYEEQGFQISKILLPL